MWYLEQDVSTDHPQWEVIGSFDSREQAWVWVRAWRRDIAHLFRVWKGE